MAWPKRRGYNSFNSYGSNKTKCSIHWSNKSSAYMVKFTNIKHWNEMKVLTNFIKNLPVGEKDVQVEENPDTLKKDWTWYFVEKHLDSFNNILDSLVTAGIFEKDFVAKPTGQTNQHQFIPVDTYLTRFKDLTGQDVKDLQYIEAKKLYRRWLMKNHPDVGGDHFVVRDVNEAWSNLEVNYFKSRKEVEYESASAGN